KPATTPSFRHIGALVPPNGTNLPPWSAGLYPFIQGRPDEEPHRCLPSMSATSVTSFHPLVTTTEPFPLGHAERQYLYGRPGTPCKCLTAGGGGMMVSLSERSRRDTSAMPPRPSGLARLYWVNRRESPETAKFPNPTAPVASRNCGEEYHSST